MANSGHCAKCGTFRAVLQRDRIVPGFLGGTYTPENIQLLCANCHEDKTKAEASHPAWRARLALRKRTPNTWNKPGWHHTDAAKRKISAGLKGRKLSAETRRRMSAKRRARVIKPETGARISAALKGRPRSPEVRAKISAGLMRRQKTLAGALPALVM